LQWKRDLNYLYIFRKNLAKLSLVEKAQDIHRHLAYCVEFKGEQVAVREMRKNLLWYIKGIRGAASLRNQLSRVSSIREIEEAVDSIFTN